MGKLGNDAISGTRFLYLARYQTVANTYAFGGSSVPGLNPTAANADVTWEESEKTDIGLEARFLNGLLGVELDFYREHRTGILASRSGQIPFAFGGPLAVENLGETKNKGLELTMTHNRSVSKNLSYSLRAIVR